MIFVLNSWIEKIISFFKKNQESIKDPLDDIECNISELEEFDLKENPFKYLDKNVKLLNYLGIQYAKEYISRKFEGNYPKGHILSYHSFTPAPGYTIMFYDDLKIQRIWLYGKFATPPLPQYPGKLPFGISFDLNRTEIQIKLSSPDCTKIIDYQTILKIKRFKDTYYFYEGCLEFYYEYESGRFDDLEIIKLPENIESTKQYLRSYLSI